MNLLTLVDFVIILKYINSLMLPTNHNDALHQKKSQPSTFNGGCDFYVQIIFINFALT